MEAMERKTFMEISTQVLIEDDYYFFKSVATDSDVRRTGEVLSWGSYDRDKLVAYKQKYGYDELNNFVKKFGDTILERKAREEAEARAKEAEDGAEDE